MRSEFNIPSLLSDNCPLWIYTANRDISQDDQEVLLEQFRSFSLQWRSHGREVQSAVSIVANRFLVLAADVLEGDISGCGIDASVRQISKLAETRGIDWISSMHIAFLDRDEVRVVDRMEFKILCEKGDISSKTNVYDASINRVGQWRSGEFLKNVSDSWHARLLPQEA